VDKLGDVGSRVLRRVVLHVAISPDSEYSASLRPLPDYHNTVVPSHSRKAAGSDSACPWWSI